MNIINLAALIKGKILNSPLISAIEGFCFDINKLKLKDAFISNNKFEIEIAIKNGAYAIIFEENLEILNDEIAYIKVEKIEFAIKRLIEFYANFKTFYLVDRIKFEILKTLNHKSLKIINSNPKEFLLDLLENDKFISNEDLFNLDYKKISDTTKNSFIRTSLFISEIFYHQKHYNLEFSKIFLPNLYEILDEFKLEFKISNLKDFRHFEPIFINNLFEIAPFGTTERVVIIESDKYFFEFEQNFLKKLDIKSVSFKKDDIKSDFKINSIDEIKNIKNFHYLLFYSSYKDVFDFLKTNKNNFLLF